MVGELAQPRLQAAEGAVAGGGGGRRHPGGKRLQHVSELLGLDPEPVDVTVVAQTMVEAGKEPAHEPPRPAVGKGGDRFGRLRGGDSRDDRRRLGLPLGRPQVGDPGSEPAPRLRPFLLEQSRQSPPCRRAGPGCLRRG